MALSKLIEIFIEFLDDKDSSPHTIRNYKGTLVDFTRYLEEEIYMQVDAGSARNLKPDSVTDAFAEYCGVKDISFAHHRLETFANTGSEENPVFVPLDALGTEFE